MDDIHSASGSSRRSGTWRDLQLLTSRVPSFANSLPKPKFEILLMIFQPSITSIKPETVPSSREARANATESQRRKCTSSDVSSPRRARSFLCPETHCGARFDRKYSLHEHMKSHTGEKPFQCDVKSCGKRFSTSGNMLRHRRNHALERFRCPASGCARIYSKYERLTQHYRIHLGSAAYPCGFPGCTKSFATSRNRARHMRRHHCVDSRRKLQAAGAQRPSRAVDTEPIVYSGSVQSFVPITSPSPLLASDGISDQDLLDLLQCLFVNDPSASW